LERPHRVKKKLTEQDKFTHRLCLALGERDPDEFLASISYRTYLRWQDYFDAEPWGEVRADLRNVVLVRMMNATGETADMPRPVWPYWDEEAATLSDVQEIKDWIRKNGHRFNRKTRGNPNC
jgi:hypothetical protein